MNISENFGNPIFGVIDGIHFTRKLISFCQTIEHHILDDLYFYLPSTYSYTQKCKRQKPTDTTYSDSRRLIARRGSFKPYIINLHLKEPEYITKYKLVDAYCSDTDIILCK